MRKPLLHTKVTVKLRKSEYGEEKWYLVVESYPVRKPGSNKPGRIIEAVNRTITTPLWDYSSVTKVDEYGNFCYKPKRDANGVIQCSQIRLTGVATPFADCASGFTHLFCQPFTCLLLFNKYYFDTIKICHYSQIYLILTQKY